MKYLIGLFICAMFIFGGATIIFAQTPQSAGVVEPSRKSEGELGVEVSNIKYEEPGIMEEEGIMYGIAGSYASHQNKIMLKLDGRLSYGQVDYSSSASGDLDDIDDYILETRFLLGYDYPMSAKAIITPYVGFGYRYLNDDSSGMTANTGAKGYERESNYLYSPIGIDAIVNLENGWSFGAIAEYDLFWYGMQRSHLEDVLTGLSTMDNDQKEGWGVRGSIKIQKKSDNIDFILEPFVRYWDIKKSEETTLTYYNFIIGKGYEPANESTEWGAKLALKF